MRLNRLEAVLKIYLDACALNRLTDDQSQSRIRNEAEAVEGIFRLISIGRIQWIASVVLDNEIRRNPNEEKRLDALTLLSLAGELLRPNQKAVQRAVALEQMGYGAFDAFHLACAEQAQVDAFLTTDDRLIRKARRNLGNLTIRVLNPLKWLQEMQ